MSNVAYTQIQYGAENGDVVVIEEGDEVKGLPAGVVKDLKELGVVGEPLKSQSEKDADIDELEAENEELQKQVEALQKQLAVFKK